MKAFFDDVRAKLFGGGLTKSQVEGINALIDGWARYGDGDKRKFAYVLATAKRETGDTMQPIEEYGKGAGHPYGLPTGPWHKIYDGNGEVQLTWERNYRFATDRLHAHGLFLDVDLERNPELARRLDIAVAVIIIGMTEGWFTGRKLGDYIGAACNFVGARAIVNANDHAAEIAGNAIEFLTALNMVDLPAPATSAPVIPAPAPVPSVPRPTGPATPSKAPPVNLWGVLTNLIEALIAALVKARSPAK